MVLPTAVPLTVTPPSVRPPVVKPLDVKPVQVKLMEGGLPGVELPEAKSPKANPPEVGSLEVEPLVMMPVEVNQAVVPNLALAIESTQASLGNDLTSEYEKFMEQLNLGSCVEVEVANEVEVPCEEGLVADLEHMPDTTFVTEYERRVHSPAVSYASKTSVPGTALDGISDVPTRGSKQEPLLDATTLDVACESEVTSSPAALPLPYTPVTGTPVSPVPVSSSQITAASLPSTSLPSIVPTHVHITTPVPVMKALHEAVATTVSISTPVPAPVPAPSVALMPSPVAVTCSIPAHSSAFSAQHAVLASTSVPVTPPNSDPPSNSTAATEIVTHVVTVRRSHRRRHSDVARASSSVEDISGAPAAKRKSSDSVRQSPVTAASTRTEPMHQQVSSSRSISSRPIIIKVQANKDTRGHKSFTVPCSSEDHPTVEMPTPEAWGEVVVQNEICVEEQIKFSPSGDDMFVAVMDTEDICLAAVEEVACSSSDDTLTSSSSCTTGRFSTQAPASHAGFGEMQKQLSPPPPPPPPRSLRLKPRRSTTVALPVLPSPVSSSSGGGEEEGGSEVGSPPPPPPPPRQPAASATRCLVLPPPPASGILLPAGRGSLSGEPKKSVTFADGIPPGRDPPDRASAIGDAPSPPPPPPPSRERRHRTKVKVIMPSSIIDSLPPPPPPPKKSSQPSPNMVQAVPTVAVPTAVMPTATAHTVAMPTGAVPTGAMPTGAVPTGAVPVAMETLGANYQQYQVHVPQQQGYPNATYAVPYNSYPQGYAVPYAPTTQLPQAAAAYTYVAQHGTVQAQSQQHLYANAATYTYHPQQLMQMSTAPPQAQPVASLPPRPPT